MNERKLIREVREWAAGTECCCSDMAGGLFCYRCQLLERIDEGLEQIGEARVPRGSAKKLKRLSTDAMRAGNMTAAVKLYNRAWEKEKKDEQG